MRYLRRDWRVYAPVLVCQILGGALGLIAAPHHFWFFNMWIGGALATPIGFGLWLAWQRKGRDVKPAAPPGETVFVGVLALILGGAALAFLPHMLREMDLLKSLRELDASQVRRISVFGADGSMCVAHIESREAIAEFVRCCRDVEGYAPGKARYRRSWYIVLTSAPPLELECHYEYGRPSVVVGDFVTKSGNSTSYHGSFSSQRLRGWFEKHLVRADR